MANAEPESNLQRFLGVTEYTFQVRISLLATGDMHFTKYSFPLSSSDSLHQNLKITLLKIWSISEAQLFHLVYSFWVLGNSFVF